MTKTYKQFLEQAPFPRPDNASGGPQYPLNPDTNKKEPNGPLELDAASVRDFNRWFEALNSKCHPIFPAKLIEDRLNFYGYTAFIDDDYSIGDDEEEGQEIFILYKEYGDSIQGVNNDLTVTNAVIILDWEKDDSEYYVNGRVEVVTHEELNNIIAQINDDADAEIDVPEGDDLEDTLDDETMIVGEGKTPGQSGSVEKNDDIPTTKEITPHGDKTSLPGTKPKGKLWKSFKDLVQTKDGPLAETHGYLAFGIDKNNLRKPNIAPAHGKTRQEAAAKLRTTNPDLKGVSTEWAGKNHKGEYVATGKNVMYHD